MDKTLNIPLKLHQNTPFQANNSHFSGEGPSSLQVNACLFCTFFPVSALQKLLKLVKI